MSDDRRSESGWAVGRDGGRTDGDGGLTSRVDSDRYSRQIRFASIGEEGQAKLASACVLIVGTGALGASLAQHMVRAGVGTVRLADRDFVEFSNLQRQSLFDEEDAAQSLPKAVAAADKLRRINSGVAVEAHVVDVNERSLPPLADGASIVLDGTDNAATRLLLSDACFARGIPLLYGGVAGSQGMSAPLVPGRTACLRCLIGEGDDGEGETCDTIGVISPAVDFVAALQAAEALKWLTGNRDAVRTTWLTADLWPFRLRESALPEGNPACPHCGGAARPDAGRLPAGGYGRGRDSKPVPGRRTAAPVAGTAVRFGAAGEEIGGPARRAASAVQDAGPIEAASLCGRDTVQVTLGFPLKLDEWRETLAARGCRLTANPYLLRAELPEGEKLALFPDGRILVQGTTDTGRAVALCREYVVR